MKASTRKAERSAGLLIFVACIAAFMIYAWLLLASEWSGIILQLTTLASVGALFGIVAWIGLTMANTPAPSANQNVG